MAAKTKQQIRESLMQQLISKGADVAHFEALIDDYVEYFGLVKKMKADIRKNGLSYTAMSAAGKESMSFDYAPDLRMNPKRWAWMKIHLHRYFDKFANAAKYN